MATPSREKFFSLLPGIPKKGDITLRTVLRNLVWENYTPVLNMHLRQLIRECLNGFKLQKQELETSRNVLLRLCGLPEHIVANAPSFECCMDNCKQLMKMLFQLQSQILEMQKNPYV